MRSPSGSQIPSGNLWCTGGRNSRSEASGGFRHREAEECLWSVGSPCEALCSKAVEPRCTQQTWLRSLLSVWSLLAPLPLAVRARARRVFGSFVPVAGRIYEPGTGVPDDLPLPDGEDPDGHPTHGWFGGFSCVQGCPRLRHGRLLVSRLPRITLHVVRGFLCGLPTQPIPCTCRAVDQR